MAPAVLLIEWLLFSKTASAHVIAAIALVCTGVGLSTLTDLSMGASGRGLAVGAAAILATAMYQVICSTCADGSSAARATGLRHAIADSTSKFNTGTTLVQHKLLPRLVSTLTKGLARLRLLHRPARRHPQ